MIIQTTKYFDKKFKKVPSIIKNQFKKKIEIFVANPYDIRLNNHRLHGDMQQYRSINITGDYRLIYENQGDDTVVLISIDTHSELYS